MFRHKQYSDSLTLCRFQSLMTQRSLTSRLRKIHTNSPEKSTDEGHVDDASAATAGYSTVGVPVGSRQRAFWRSRIKTPPTETTNRHDGDGAARRDAVNRVRRVSVYAPCVSRRVFRSLFFTTRLSLSLPPLRALLVLPSSVLLSVALLSSSCARCR